MPLKIFILTDERHLPVAEIFERKLTKAYELAMVSIVSAPGAAPAVSDDPTRDLWIVLFDHGQLPLAEADFWADHFGPEKLSWPLVLPIAMDPAHATPPDPWNGKLAVVYQTDSEEHMSASIRKMIIRSGALLMVNTDPDRRVIFISYKRDGDGARIAEKVRDHLRGQHYQAAIDTDLVEPGEDIYDELVSYIDRASCLLVVDTPDATVSDYIPLECERAYSRNIPVLPVLCRENEGGDWSFPDLKMLERYAEVALSSWAETEMQMALERVQQEMEHLLSDCFSIPVFTNQSGSQRIQEGSVHLGQKSKGTTSVVSLGEGASFSPAP